MAPPLCQRENFISTGRQSLVSHVNVTNFLVRNTKPKWATVTVELEKGLNADSDPTSQFVTQKEKRGTWTGYVWTCKCCEGTFTGQNKMGFNLVKNADPVFWRKSWGSATCPKLTTAAMRILAQPCSASSAEQWARAYQHPEQDVKGSGQAAGESVF